MIFTTKYPKLLNGHAFLSPSKYHWINYDTPKLLKSFKNHLNVERGTKIHELASRLISLKVKLPRTTKTIDMFVNDAIGFDMTPEVLLYYSPFCYGTTDAIGYDTETSTLHVFDLKTGDSAGNIIQLRIYAALACLEYKMDPYKTRFDLRLYHNDMITKDIPSSDEINKIMLRIAEQSFILTKEAE